MDGLTMADERVTRLEQMRENDRETMAEVKIKLDAVHRDVQEIKQELRGQKGFVAGAAAVFALVWGVIGSMAYAAYQWVTSKGDI
jgi:hypothetical protein